MEGGREGGRKREGEEWMEGVREGGKEGGRRKREREEWMEGVREGGKEGGRRKRERGKEGGRELGGKEGGRKRVREEKEPWETHVNLFLAISLPQVMQESCFIQIHQGTYTH